MAAELVPVLQSLLSSDNAQRSAAERQYNQVKAQQPGIAVAALLQVIAEPQIQIPVREQGAVLLRQCLAQPNAQNSIWMQLGAAQSEVKTRLLQAVGTEQQDKVRRKVADCLQSLANQLIDIDENQRPANADAWPELLPALLQLATDANQNPGVRADALWTLKELSSSIWQCLVASASQTAQVLQSCLGDGSQAVQAQASTLLCNLAAQLERKQDRQAFVPLIPAMFGVLSQLASAQDPKLLNEVLQALQAEGFLLWFFRDHVASHLLPGLCQIAKSHPNEDAKKLALEALVNLMEASPKTMLKVPNSIQMFLDACLPFVMAFDDDVTEWANLDEDDENDETKVGTKAIDRLCESFQKDKSFDQVLAVLQPALTQLFQAQDWKSQATVLSVLMTIAEYIDEEAMVQQMLGAVKQHLKSPHVRVRYLAWFTLLQFAQDQPEAMSGSTWSAELLPDILAGLGDSCPRVVIACMGAFQHFGQTIEEEDLEPFVQPLMQTLGGRLQGQGNARLQREAITSITTIASQCGDSMAQYYGALMPVLKQLISVALHKEEERMLLAKCFECISIFANSVGRATFRPDAEGMIQAMVQATQVPNLAKDDPVYEYIMAASERFAYVLKEDFLPFVPHLLPMVLEKLKFQPKEFSGDVRDVQGEDVNVAVVNKDGKTTVLVMSTSQMEDTQHALECVHAFVSHIGVGYSTYIPQTAEALLPVFDFLMSEEIRDLAFECWGKLSKCARTAGNQPVLSQLCSELMKRIIPRLADTDSEVAALKTRTMGVAKCIEAAGPNILDPQQVQQIGQLSLQLLSNSLGRKMKKEQKQSEKRANTQDLDETAASDDDDDEEQLRTASMNLAGSLMEHHPDHFMAQCLAAYLPVVQQLIQPTASDNDRSVAAIVAAHICEHLGERAVSQWPSFLPQLMQDMQASNDEVRGVACYAVSFAARLPAFAPNAAPAAQRASTVVTQTRARSKKKSEKTAQGAADNALSVLLEILEHHSGAVQGDLCSVWLAGLPCQEDAQEGMRNNKALVRLVQQQTPWLVGEGGRNIPRVLELLVNAYKTEMVDDETSTAIGQLLLTLGEAQLEKFSAGYAAKQKKKLIRVAKEAQKAAAAGGRSGGGYA